MLLTGRLHLGDDVLDRLPHLVIEAATEVGPQGLDPGLRHRGRALAEPVQGLKLFSAARSCKAPSPASTNSGLR